MKHSRESKAKLELFRVRLSQPPGREGRDVSSHDAVLESGEVKDVCSESAPEPRERVKVPDVYPLRKGADKMGWRVKDERQLRSGGVTDSIESDRGYGATRRGLGDC